VRRPLFAAALAFDLLVLGAAACGTGDAAAPALDAGGFADAKPGDATLADGASDVADADASDAAATADVAQPDDDAATDAGADVSSVDAACMTTVTGYPIAASPHVLQCSPVSYATNPPTSGPHYPVWAAYAAYGVPVPRGFYVHDLEHGAIVILYNCPSGCAQDVADVEALLTARAPDPLCTSPVQNRFVVAPDPAIPTRFAAAAWGYALTSDCFDLPALGAFIDAHYAHGAENFCGDGVDVTAPDAGIAADCGQ
jgi:hypothetical protein